MNQSSITTRNSAKKKRYLDDDDDDDITEIITLDNDSSSSSNDCVATRKRPTKPNTNIEPKPSTSRQAASSSTTVPESNESDENSLAALTLFIVEDLHPVSIFKEVGFKRLMSTIQPNLTLPPQDDIINHILLMYGIERANLLDMLEKVDAIAIAVERWTSFTENTYATIKANFINAEWEPQSYVLSTVQLNEPLTFTHLNDKVLEVVKSWDIDKKIVSVCYDWYPEPADVRTVMFEKTYESLGTKLACFAIKLQSVIDTSLNSFDELKSLIDKSSRLVTYFVHNNNAEIYLHKYQQYLEIPCDQLIQSSNEEINSTYLMADRLVSQKKAVMAVLLDTDATESEVSDELMIDEAEWKILEELVATLKPFQLAKVVLYRVKDHVDSISVVKPIIHSFCTNFLTATDETIIIRDLKTRIKEELLQKFQLYDGNVEMDAPDYFDIATYLDPRYKNQEYLSDRNRETIRQYIHDVYFAKNESNGVNVKKTAISFKALSILFPSTSAQTPENDDECTRYFKEPEINKTLSTHKWWKQHDRIYPVLSNIAKRHLCTHATSKSIFTSRNAALKRKNLTPQLVDKLIFLNHKLKFDDK